MTCIKTQNLVLYIRVIIYYMIAWGAEGIEYKQEGLKKVPRGEDTITNQRDDNVDTKTEQS